MDSSSALLQLRELQGETSLLQSPHRSITLACLAGFISHLYFSRGYKDQSAVGILNAGVAVFVAFSALSIHSCWGNGLFATIFHICIYAGAFLATLFSSIVVYRLFFHRIRKFPGPFWAKVSKFYMVSHSRHLKQHLHVRQLHEQYGDLVRTGPREISVIKPEAINVLYGPKSNCTRGPWYGMSNHADAWSLHTTQDRDLHRQRRRVWDRGFSTKALNEYMPKVIGHTNALLEQISRRASQPVRVDQWFNFYSFDVMGDVGFSKDFGMIAGGEEHSAIKTLHSALRSVRPLSSVPWLTRIILKLSHGSLNSFLDWCYQRTVEKRNDTSNSKDIFSWLLAEEKTGIKMSKGIMQAEGRLIIVAGSDTTAATLTNIFYNLVAFPEVAKKLQKEIDSVFDDESDMSYEKIRRIEYIQAVINETLRLFPAVPSGLERVTPPEGLEISGIYIPGDVVISVPQWTVHRDARNFVEPDSFVPERWTTRPELVLTKDIFFPFSQGRDSCIGKSLAIMELSMVVARLLKRFDITSSDPHQLATYPEKAEDTFTIFVTDLSITFTPRVIKP